MSLEIFPEFLRRFVPRIYDGRIREDRFDMVTDDRVVRAPEHDRLDVAVKLQDIVFDFLRYLGGVMESFFDQRHEFWGGDLLDDNAIIMEMHPVLVCPYLHGRLSREDSHLFVSGFKDLFGTGDGDSEDLTVREAGLLEVPDGVCGRGVAGKYDDGRTLIEQKFHSFFRVLSDGRIIEVSVGTSGIVPEVEKIILGEYFSEFPENGQSPDAGVEESDHKGGGLAIHILLDKLRHIGVLETFLQGDVAVVDKLQEIVLDDLHSFTAGCLHDGGDLVELVLPDEVGDGGVLDKDFFGKLESAPVAFLQEALREYRDKCVGELEPYLVLLSGRECIDDTGNGLVGAPGMKGGKYQVSGFRKLECHLDLVHIAHLPEENDLRILAHRSDERRIVIGHIPPYLLLFHDGLLVGVDVLYRILDGDDVFRVVCIDLVYHRSQRGGFTASGRPGHEDEALSCLGYILVDKREVQISYRGDVL